MLEVTIISASAAIFSYLLFAADRGVIIIGKCLFDTHVVCVLRPKPLITFRVRRCMACKIFRFLCARGTVSFCVINIAFSHLGGLINIFSIDEEIIV